MSVDPVAVRPTGDNFNRYWYADNNPYKFTDPDGRESGCIYGGGCGDRNLTSGEQQAFAAVADFLPGAGDVIAVGQAVANPSVVSVAAAVVGLVPVVGDVAGKALKAGGNIAENAAKGKAGEAATRASLGDRVAGEQVTFVTSDGTRARADFVTTDRGVVETKTGGARLSPGQTKLKSDIDAGREVTPVGQNATNAGLPAGQPTRMSSCAVDRQC